MSGLNVSSLIKSVPVLVALGGWVAPGVTHAAATKAANQYQQVIPTSFDYTSTGEIRNRPSTINGPAQLSFNGVPAGTYVTGSNQTIQLGQFVVNPARTATGADAVTTYNGTPFVIQIRAPQFDKTKDVPILSKVLPSFGRSFHLKNQTMDSLLIKGHLNGTVSGSGASNVTATVDQTRLGTIDKLPKNTAVNYSFPVRYGQLKLPTSWKMNTTANALAGAAIPAGSTVTSASFTPPSTGPVSVPATLPAPVPAAAPATSDYSVGSAAAPSVSAQLLATPAAEMLAETPSTDPTPTPEPTTILTFVVALGGFSWTRRRSLRA